MSAPKIIKVNATRSTNDRVKMLIKSKKIKSGDFIVAKYQYGGRGQHTNKWYSSYGKNLLCSLLYKPLDLNSNQVFCINQGVSLAVLKTIRKFNNEKCLIKWPNDILSVNKKISGILIENSLSLKRINYSIIGVGINVNQVLFKKLPNATSLKKISNSNIIIQEVFNELIDNYKFFLSKINESDYINEEYNKNIFGKDGCNFVINGKRQYGNIISISNNGIVKLNLDSKGIQEYDPRKVKILYN
ncbi:biotin--[acetyl-CoA-carboxylase] ligase [Flavobacteriaceae bacterium]|nr:biotin--[acetyl-CoA-carboxylase] ligase [Flavobacteriaceae bacterium]